MHTLKVPKRAGAWRTIYVPNAEEKAASKSWIPLVLHELMLCDHRDVHHGFTNNRSPVTNALAHRGWKYSLTMDLKDFFDSVTMNHLPGSLRLNPGPGKDCFYDGAARQGLPSSPIIANLAIMPVIKEIMALRTKGRFGVSFVFTVYADDLSFSFELESVGKMLMREVPKIVERHGFKINERKTHWQCASAGRRIITGVAVDNKEVYVPREVKRKLRAARHQINHGLKRRNLRRLFRRRKQIVRKGQPAPTLHGLLVSGHRGLQGWARLRLPNGYKPNTRITMTKIITTMTRTVRAQMKPVRAWFRKFA